jgi:hypothetical protein
MARMSSTIAARDQHTECARQARRPAHLAQVRDAGLEAHPEKQKHDAELREDLEHLGRLHEPEHRRADDDAGQDLADDRGLTDPLNSSSPSLAANSTRNRSVSAPAIGLAAAGGGPITARGTAP